MKLKIPFITKFFGGAYIGAILDTYGKAAALVSGVQFLMLIIILYTTSAGPYIQKYAPWLSFPFYLTVALVGVLILMVLARLFILPSSYTFFNRQVWGYNNPMRAKLEEMEEKLVESERIQEKLEQNQIKIMKKLGIEEC